MTPSSTPAQFPPIQRLTEYLLELERFIASQPPGGKKNGGGGGSKRINGGENDEWTLIREHLNTRLYLNKRNGAGAAYFPRFPGPAEVAFALFYDDAATKRIEPMINEIDLVHRYDDSNAVYRMSIHPIQYVISARDVVYHDYNTYDAMQDAWISVSTSVEHERAPPVPGIVRADQRLGGVIARYPGKAEEDSTTCTVLIYLDLDAVLPSGVPNWLRKKIDYLGAISLGDGLINLGRMANEKPLPVGEDELKRLREIRRVHKMRQVERVGTFTTFATTATTRINEEDEMRGKKKRMRQRAMTIVSFATGFTIGCLLEIWRGGGIT